MACAGFSCSRNVLALLNVLYIIVALVLIGVAAYGKAVAMIATVNVMGGIIGCGVFLLLIAFVGLIGAIRHHQVLLFFYMIILFLLFLVQFAVACACLALSDAQQRDLFTAGWKSASAPLKTKTQEYFNCCGYDESTQINMNTTDGLGHPSCSNVEGCKNVNATCCEPLEMIFSNELTTCPVKSCSAVIEPVLHQAVKVVGGLGLFFSFTEIFGVWLAFRYRNQKDPHANPSAFL